MAWCENQLGKFNEKLKLDAARKGRIDSAIARFKSLCEGDEELKVAADGAPFLQGSVATKTAIRPLANDEFDVDVVYPFNLSAFPDTTTPREVIDWFTGRLKQSDFYKNNLTPKNRCVRIDYAGDFHLDIIPATKAVADHQPFAVPARDTKGWVTNDPLGFVNWVAVEVDRGTSGQDTAGDGRFVRCCRIMKRWRDEFFSFEAAPSSILLTTMLGKHDAARRDFSPPLQNPLYYANARDLSYLYDMMRLTHSCVISERGTAFLHPTIQGADLSQGWDKKYLDEFLKKLQQCIDRVRAAIDEPDESKAAGQLRLAFGNSFPEN